MLRSILDRDMNGGYLYDGVDAFDKHSDEVSRRYVEQLGGAKKLAEEDDIDVTRDPAAIAALAALLLHDTGMIYIDADRIMPCKDTDAIRLCITRNELLAKYPQFSKEIRAIAYQAGLYESKNTTALDPAMNTFFRSGGSPSQLALPPDIAAFREQTVAFTTLHSTVNNEATPRV